MKERKKLFKSLIGRKIVGLEIENEFHITFVFEDDTALNIVILEDDNELLGLGFEFQEPVQN